MRSALRWGVVALGSAAALALWRRSSGRTATGRALFLGRLDGVIPGGLDRGGEAHTARAPGPHQRTRVTDAELARRIRERAYLEGDFVLRSGRRSRYYLDKYRFETDPELCASSASGSQPLSARVPSGPTGWRAPSSAPSRSPLPPRLHPGCPS